MHQSSQEQTRKRDSGFEESGTTRSSILGIQELEDRLYHPDLSKRLVVSPLVSPRIQDGTIDIRLGTKFILTQRAEIQSIDPLRLTPDDILKVLQRVDLPMGVSLTLHPDMFILAGTLEYIALPSDLSASVVTRSSYGRLGLLSATAVHVHPSYKGCLTLELVNYGDTAILLYPGLRIAQLVVSRAGEAAVPEQTKYQLVTEPEFPRLWDEPELRILGYLHTRADTVRATPITFA